MNDGQFTPKSKVLCGILSVAVGMCCRPTLRAQNVLTYHNDSGRTGVNSSETHLAPTNVNANTFGLLFTLPVDGQIYAQPLYVAGVPIVNEEVHNVVIVATENDSVYAFDAETNSPPLWRASFINPAAGVTTVPASDVNSTDISPVIGITSTPVIDTSTMTVYVEARTKEVTSSATNWVHRLHALDLTSGSEKFGGPINIAPVIDGNGDGNDGAGHVPFNGLRQLNRPGLLLNNGVVYAAFASLGDNPPYHGWLLGFNAQSLQPQGVFNSTPNGSDGGFWESGCGPAADENGDIYIASGNGTFDGATNNDYGDTFLKLTVNGANLGVTDYFTPYNEQYLDESDLDVGSSGVVVLPDDAGNAGTPHLLVGGDKSGTLYLMNRDILGTFNPNVNRVPQELGGFNGLFMTPAYFNGVLYCVGTGGALEAFACANASFSQTALSSGADAFAYPGATPSISANGLSNAIVWAVGYSASGVLRAYNATNLANQLYDSRQAGSRDGLGQAVKFAVPTIAN